MCIAFHNTTQITVLISVHCMQVALRHPDRSGIKLQETATLSLGTGQSVSSTVLTDADAGAYQWVVQGPGRLIDILMESPPLIQSAVGEYLLYEVQI